MTGFFIMLGALVAMAIAAIPMLYFEAHARWLAKPRPGDIPYLHRHLEIKKRTVLDIQFEGFDCSRLQDGRLSYRVYRAKVRDSFGVETIGYVGVWANAFGFTGIRGYPGDELPQGLRLG